LRKAIRTASLTAQKLREALAQFDASTPPDDELFAEVDLRREVHSRLTLISLSSYPLVSLLLLSSEGIGTITNDWPTPVNYPPPPASILRFFYFLNRELIGENLLCSF